MAAESVFLDFTIESLFRSFLRLDINVRGIDSNSVWELELPPGVSVVRIDEQSGVELVSNRILRCGTSATGEARARLTIVGGEEQGVQDSGWRYYPLITARCHLSIKVGPVRTLTVRFVFPKYCHIIPTYTQFYLENEPVGHRCSHLQYPKVQMGCYIILTDLPGGELRFEALFREATLPTILTTLLPLLVNFVVVIVGVLPSVPMIAKIPLAVGIISFYFSLWSWSNVLKSVPTLLNILTTLSGSVLVFNLIFIIALVTSWMPIVWILASLFVVAIALTLEAVLRFIFYPPQMGFPKPLLFKLQEVVEKWYNQRLPVLLDAITKNCVSQGLRSMFRRWRS